MTEALGRVSLALPFAGVMSEDQVDRVCAVLRKVRARMRDVRERLRHREENGN